MDYLQVTKNFITYTKEGFSNTILLPNVVLIFISSIIVAILKVVHLILEPMNYVLVSVGNVV